MKKIFIILSGIFVLSINCIYSATYSVTSLANTGTGTLRDCITQANANSGHDTIKFNVSGTITITSALPALTDNAGVTIDGFKGTAAGTPNTTSVFGGTLNPVYNITLKSTSINQCFTITSDYNVIRGLCIESFGASSSTWDDIAIYINGGNYNKVLGCYLGMNKNGSTIGGSVQFSGVRINGNYNQVGDGTAAGINLISGNTFTGVYIYGTNIHDNIIKGNRIGLQANGTAIVSGGSQDSGVDINDSGYNNTIEGNVISGNTNRGIGLNSSHTSGNKVYGNYIGCSADGTASIAYSNQTRGVYITDSPNNQIGGTNSNQRNIISGNTSYGIFYQGSTSNGNKIHGNYVGTNKDGNAILTGTTGQDHGVGVSYSAPSSNNTIGGTNAGEGNVFSGNTSSGIWLTYGTFTVAGNIIGLQADGTSHLANNSQDNGVYITSANNTIGGTTTAHRNIISGNTYSGVSMGQSGADNNNIYGNYIGTQSDGTSAVSGSSQDYGVYIWVGKNNKVGGTTTGQANTIAYNTSGGVWVGHSLATGNAIRRNLIYSNGGLPIDLVSGGNTEKAAPVITSVTSTSISGTAVSGDYVEIFSNSVPSCTDAMVYIGQAYTSGGTWTLNGSFNTSHQFLANATPSTNNTSEFSTPHLTLASDSLYIESGDSVALSASGFLSYTWLPSHSLTADNIFNPIAFPDGTTTYTVTGSVGMECISTATVTVYANIPDCGNLPNISLPPPPFTTRGKNCTPITGGDYENKYRIPQYWIPDASTPVKTILINYIVCRDSNGGNGWQDSPQFRANVYQMFINVNLRYSNSSPMNYNLTCPPTYTHVYDTKIRFKLNEIVFIDNSVFNNYCNFSDGHIIDDYVYTNYPNTRGAMNHIFTHAQEGPSPCGYMGYYDDNPLANSTRAYVLTQKMWALQDMNHVDYISHIAHEYGHALGEGHTYDTENMQIAYYDYLDDVFGLCGEPSQCTPAPGYGCLLDKTFFNNVNNGAALMSGVTIGDNNAIANYISPKQEGRMHRALSLYNSSFVMPNNPMYQYVYEKTSYTVSKEITSNETWDFGMQMYQDIVVKSGNTLTLQCELRMPIDGKIIVESGATLIIDGGVVTTVWDAMWNGIVLNAGSTLLVDNGIIENAKIGIESIGGAQFTLQNNSLLNKNYQGILVRAYVGTHPGVIKNSKISCVDNSGSPVNLSLSPHVGQRAYSGININDVDQMFVGVDVVGETNTFDNLEYGILNLNSSLTAYNNNFIRITSPNSTRGRAISSINTAPPATEKTLTVGGNGNAYQKNIFTESHIGVYAQTNQDVNVIANDFNNFDHTAVYLQFISSYANIANISNNNIDDCQTGIYSYGNSGSDRLIISQNNINLASPTANSKPNSTGISVNTPVLNLGIDPITFFPLPRVDILDNDIKRVSTGIESTNFGYMNINQNTISDLSDLGSAIASNGILATTCPYSNINYNQVSAANSQNSYWMNGIRVESSYSSVILHNKSENIGSGLFFGGANQLSEIAVNEMKNNYWGFVLNYGETGPQYGDSRACENSWEGTFVGSNLYSYYSDGTLSPWKLYTPTIGVFCNPNGGTGICKNPDPLYFVNTVNPTVGIYYPISISQSTVVSGRAFEDGKKQEMLKIAKGQKHYPIYNESANWIAKYGLYNSLKKDSNLESIDPYLKSFKDSASQTNLGKIREVSLLLANQNKDFIAAQNILNTLTSTNKVEQNLIDVFSIIIEQNNSDTLDNLQVAKLRKVAKQCPYEGGNGVYNARVLLSKFDNSIYTNDCEILSPNKSTKNNLNITTQNIANEKKVAIYPNPADDKLSILIYAEKTDVTELEIYDLAGKLILFKHLSVDNDIATVPISTLKSGVYIYKIKKNNQLESYGRLSIIH